MVPMSSYSDAELAGVLTYIRNSFGNRAPAVEPKAVAARRSEALKTRFRAEIEARWDELKK